MDLLRKIYENLGFKTIITYVQSGNVIFTHQEMESNKLEEEISRQIEKEVGFSVPVHVMTTDTLKNVIDKNPYLNDPAKNQAFMHVTFLSRQPEQYDHEFIETKKQAGEELFFSDKVVYLYCPDGYGKTKLTNNLLETMLNTEATTRNWKTTTELLRIARQAH